MAIHPKILERANAILAHSEEEVLKQVSDISNVTVLNVVYEQESIGQKREAILETLKNKLGLKPGEVPKTIESLSTEYQNAITESEEETFVFDTNALRGKEEEEEDKVDSSTDSNELSQSS